MRYYFIHIIEYNGKRELKMNIKKLDRRGRSRPPNIMPGAGETTQLTDG
jgi:hypothetical protein